MCVCLCVLPIMRVVEEKTCILWDQCEPRVLKNMQQY